MAKENLNRIETESEPLVMERTFNAPVDAVWKAITDLDQMRQWYFTNLKAFKPEVGFETQFTVTCNGADHPHAWKVTDVVPGKKIAYSWKYPNHPGDSVVTMELFAEGKQTRLQLTHVGLETFLVDNNPMMERTNFIQGWTQLIGTSLKNFVENPEFVISRTFDAPRDLVWKAWTTPEMMAKWWGPKGATVSKCTIDLRPGGTHHYSMKTSDGIVLWGKFVYREVVAPEKLVFISSFSDDKGGVTRHPMNPNWPLEMLSTITFDKESDKTKITVRWSPHNSSTDEIQTFVNGMGSMNQGWGGTLEQLTAYLSSL